jgi:Zn-dependent protease with chaperone function
MPFLLLLFLTLACLEDNWEDWDWLGSPGLSALLTWSVMAAWVGLAAFLARQTHRQLVATPGRRETIAERYTRWRFYHAIGLYLVYSATLYAFGWGAFVQGLVPPGVTLFPGGEVLVLAPFLAGLVLSWVFFYDAERALYDSRPNSNERYWSRWHYVGFHVRTNLGLVAIPILLLIVQRTVDRTLKEFGPGWSAYVAPLLGLGVALAIFLCLPWILRLILKVQPMPHGPLRARLEALAKRLNFGYSDILLWNTRRGVANAMVAGVLPRPRYVLLTDRLVAELSPEELDAVFGHEAGHVKHWHMLYYAIFMLFSIFVLWTGLSPFLPESAFLKKAMAFPFVLILAAYIFLVFGFLTRRCERQADIYGCRAASCGRPSCTGHDEATTGLGGGGLCPTGIRTFIAALEKVASLNGISRDKPGLLQSWQHSTIARRVEFLQSMLADTTLEPRFQRKVALVKWGLLLGLGTALAVLVAVQGWN